MSAKDPLCDGEEGEYDWPCKRCGKPFRPRRITRFKDAPFQQCCKDCQTQNLLEMIFHEPEGEP